LFFAARDCPPCYNGERMPKKNKRAKRAKEVKKLFNKKRGGTILALDRKKEEEDRVRRFKRMEEIQEAVRNGARVMTSFGRVVGTKRVLSPEEAREAGWGTPQEVADGKAKYISALVEDKNG
jgi:hypothetical protein